MTMQSQLNQTKVSLREVKEESYRALRFLGYSWGQAQVAGRVAGMAQVLWGTGITAILADSKRLLGSKRLPVTNSIDRNTIALRARGTQFTTFGPMAAALVMTGVNISVEVSQAEISKEFATSFWDLDLQTDVYWGSGGSFAGYSLRSGDLYSHGAAALGKGLRWQIGHGVVTDGELVLSAEDRKDQISNSLRNGVVVDPVQWAALKKLSWKFLVPE